MKQIVCFLFSLVILSCTDHKKIVNRKDYKEHLTNTLTFSSRKNMNAELKFWKNRAKKDSTNYVNKLKSASAHFKLFHLSGNVSHLHAADRLLKSVSSRLNNTDPEILFAISQNSISQHRFKEAAKYNNDALQASGDPYVHTLLSFDTKMEQGEYRLAAKVLKKIGDKLDFQYLIRKAKLEDHLGNSENAINLMQEAFRSVKNKDITLSAWTLSNLGDMYSHSGRLGEAYKTYLRVLQMDPSNLYVLKGIAWLAYSNDKNIKEAKRLLNYILAQTNMPDAWLTLAEIEEWEGNQLAKEDYLHRFVSEVTKPGYESMYTKYLISLYCDELKQPEKALQLAQEEISNRATPETYSWLARAYFHNRESQKALNILLNYVYGKTFEPETLYYTAKIFSRTGKTHEAIQLFKQCLGSSMELGPVKTLVIEKELKRIVETSVAS